MSNNSYFQRFLSFISNKTTKETCQTSNEETDNEKNQKLSEEVNEIENENLFKNYCINIVKNKFLNKINSYESDFIKKNKFSFYLLLIYNKIKKDLIISQKFNENENIYIVNYNNEMFMIEKKAKNKLFYFKNKFNKNNCIIKYGLKFNDEEENSVYNNLKKENMIEYLKFNLKGKAISFNLNDKLDEKKFTEENNLFYDNNKPLIYKSNNIYKYIINYQTNNYCIKLKKIDGEFDNIFLSNEIININELNCNIYFKNFEKIPKNSIIILHIFNENNINEIFIQLCEKYNKSKILFENFIVYNILIIKHEKFFKNEKKLKNYVFNCFYGEQFKLSIIKIKNNNLNSFGTKNDNLIAKKCFYLLNNVNIIKIFKFLFLIVLLHFIYYYISIKIVNRKFKKRI